MQSSGPFSAAVAATCTGVNAPYEPPESPEVHVRSDRVSAEQDRVRAERNLADTEYLAREVAALRIALGEVATRDFLRSELRALLEA